MLQAINIPQCVRTPHDVDIRLHSTSDIEAGQGTLQEGNPNGTISDQSGILTQILLECQSRNAEEGGDILMQFVGNVHTNRC